MSIEIIIAILAVALIALAVVRAVMRRQSETRVPPDFMQDVADYFELRRNPAEAWRRNYEHGVVNNTLNQHRDEWIGQEGGDNEMGMM